MQTLKEFNPEAHGLRVAGTPITRKPRTPSSKSAPKPKYADAVWFSFTEGKPLEVSVPVARVEDTIRQLKQAARYLDRSHKPKAEVRVQISVEPELDTDGQPVKPAKSLVKFLGHEPFLLGRRVAKERLDSGPDAVAVPSGGSHRRRTVAGARHAKTALRCAVVRAVITAEAPSFPQLWKARGLCVFPPCTPLISGVPSWLPHRENSDRFPLPSCLTREVYDRRQRMECYREYLEIDDASGHYTAEVRMCHDFPPMAPTGSNTVAIFDERVLRIMTDGWMGRADMPTDSWPVSVPA